MKKCPADMTNMLGFIYCSVWLENLSLVVDYVNVDEVSWIVKHIMYYENFMNFQ